MIHAIYCDCAYIYTRIFGVPDGRSTYTVRLYYNIDDARKLLLLYYYIIM